MYTLTFNTITERGASKIRPQAGELLIKSSAELVSGVCRGAGAAPTGPGSQGLGGAEVEVGALP